MLTLLFGGRGGAGVIRGGCDADDGDGDGRNAEGGALVEATVSVGRQRESAPWRADVRSTRLLAHGTLAQR
jgi:hypothetical protein